MHQALAVISKADRIVFQTLTGFLHGFGEASADAHYFTYAFHLQTQCIVCSFELIKIPARDLYDHVIQRRFKIGRCCFGDLVFQFIQCITNRQFRCYLGNGITRSL